MKNSSLRNAKSLSRAFTFVEIIIASFVLSLFLAGAYSIFFGSQRIANKATWLQIISSDLRRSEQIITKAIKTTSYPSTLLPTAIIDAGGSLERPAENSQNFYVKILCGLGEKNAAQLLALNDGIFLVMPKCSPEKQGFPANANSVGSITWIILKAVKDPTAQNMVQIVYEERSTSYSTEPPNYVSKYTSDFSGIPPTYRSVICQNIQSIKIDATPGHKPSQITITLRAVYPKDSNLYREATSAAVPNVGIYIPSTT